MLRSVMAFVWRSLPAKTYRPWMLSLEQTIYLRVCSSLLEEILKSLRLKTKIFGRNVEGKGELMFTNRPAMKMEVPVKIPQIQTKMSELQKVFAVIRDAVQKNLLTKNNNDTNVDSEQLTPMIEECFNQTLEEEKILYNHST